MHVNPRETRKHKNTHVQTHANDQRGKNKHEDRGKETGGGTEKEMTNGHICCLDCRFSGGACTRAAAPLRSEIERWPRNSRLQRKVARRKSGRCGGHFPEAKCGLCLSQRDDDASNEEDPTKVNGLLTVVMIPISVTKGENKGGKNRMRYLSLSRDCELVPTVAWNRMVPRV